MQGEILKMKNKTQIIQIAILLASILAGSTAINTNKTTLATNQTKKPQTETIFTQNELDAIEKIKAQYIHNLSTTTINNKLGYYNKAYKAGTLDDKRTTIKSRLLANRLSEAYNNQPQTVDIFYMMHILNILTPAVWLKYGKQEIINPLLDTIKNNGTATILMPQYKQTGKKSSAKGKKLVGYTTQDVKLSITDALKQYAQANEPEGKKPDQQSLTEKIIKRIMQPQNYELDNDVLVGYTSSLAEEINKLTNTQQPTGPIDPQQLNDLQMIVRNLEIIKQITTNEQEDTKGINLVTEDSPRQDLYYAIKRSLCYRVTGLEETITTLTQYIKTARTQAEATEANKQPEVPKTDGTNIGEKLEEQKGPQTDDKKTEAQPTEDQQGEETDENKQDETNTAVNPPADQQGGNNQEGNPPEGQQEENNTGEQPQNANNTKVNPPESQQGEETEAKQPEYSKTDGTNIEEKLEEHNGPHTDDKKTEAQPPADQQGEETDENKQDETNKEIPKTEAQPQNGNNTQVNPLVAPQGGNKQAENQGGNLTKSQQPIATTTNVHPQVGNQLQGNHHNGGSTSNQTTNLNIIPTQNSIKGTQSQTVSPNAAQANKQAPTTQKQAEGTKEGAAKLEDEFVELQTKINKWLEYKRNQQNEKAKQINEIDKQIKQLEQKFIALSNK